MLEPRPPARHHIPTPGRPAHRPRRPTRRPQSVFLKAKSECCSELSFSLAARSECICPAFETDTDLLGPILERRRRVLGDPLSLLLEQSEQSIDGRKSCSSKPSIADRREH